MKGHLRSVADRAFPELWQPLTEHDDCPENVFGEIYVGMSRYLREPEPQYERDEDGKVRNVSETIEQRSALAAVDASRAEELLAGLSANDFPSEANAARAISSAYEVLADVATQNLAAEYLRLMREFVDRYSLRYYVDDTARLWLSFSGLATALFEQLRQAAHGHPHLLQELNAFEHSLAECLEDPHETRIKTVIQKQINVLEAFGSQHHLVTGNTLGRMLEEVGSWPHRSLTDAAKSLYRFTCDYPGIRHAGNFDSAVRTLDLRDLAGITLSLVSLVAYLADGFESHVGSTMRGETVYRDSIAGAAAPWLAVSGDAGSV